LRIFPTGKRESRGLVRALAWALAALLVSSIISSGRAAERKADWARYAPKDVHASTQQEAPTMEAPPAKEAPAKEVALTERTFACRPLVRLIQFFKLFSLGEREDAGRFLDTKIRRGDCIEFEAGDKVNLTKQESNGLFVCLRRVGFGSGLCFWTLSAWLTEAQL
jgi:hypothetical protein